MPTRSELDDLLNTVKWGICDEAKIREVALALADGRIADADTYTAIHVVGRSGLVRHESLVASFLDGRAGMMAARISLQALCAWFGRVRHIQAMLGHVLLETTEIYTQGSIRHLPHASEGR